MQKNVGKVDRVLRIGIGVLIIGWGISTHNWFGAIGILPIITGLTRWCPAYTPLGISTDTASKSQ